MKFEVSLYKSLLNNNRTHVLIKNDEEYTRGYLEGHVHYEYGMFQARITDRWNQITFDRFNTLKEAINYCKEIIEELD